jgi:hypothetical protein
MTIKTRLKKLEENAEHSVSGVSPIDMAAIEKYQQDVKAWYAALKIRWNDYKTGNKTHVPDSPILPPCYNEWRLKEYGPQEPVDWTALMAQVRKKLAEDQAR